MPHRLGTLHPVTQGAVLDRPPVLQGQALVEHPQLDEGAGLGLLDLAVLQVPPLPPSHPQRTRGSAQGRPWPSPGRWSPTSRCCAANCAGTCRTAPAQRRACAEGSALGCHLGTLTVCLLTSRTVDGSQRLRNKLYCMGLCNWSLLLQACRRAGSPAPAGLGVPPWLEGPSPVAQGLQGGLGVWLCSSACRASMTVLFLKTAAICAHRYV
jgi:hypothetical protein